MIVAVTGTPGCGKTTISKVVSRKTGLDLIDLNRAIKLNKLYSGYDRKNKAYIADMRKIRNFVRNKTKNGGWIIDSHLSHFLDADIVIVLRCKPNELEKRLKKKGWSYRKINENFEAELINLIAWESRQRHKKVYDIDTTKVSPEKIASIIVKVLKGHKNIDKYRKMINWIE